MTIDDHSRDGATCGSSNVVSGSAPRFYVIVPPAQTVHLTYPRPIVYSPLSGQSCVGFGGALNVDISINGLPYLVPGIAFATASLSIFAVHRGLELALPTTEFGQACD